MTEPHVLLTGNSKTGWERMEMSDMQIPLHDILLLLGYTPTPDECIGQATIHKALAELRERDAELERDNESFQRL